MIFIYQIDYEKIKENISLLNKNDYLVLKSNAYGFGFKKVFKIANELGMNKFALLDIKDCLYIKKHYPNSTVLLLGAVDYKNLSLCEKYGIVVTITSIKDLKFFINYDLTVQIEVNSGMNRFGVRKEEVKQIIDLINNSRLKLVGIYSHNATTNNIYIDQQIAYFKQTVCNKRDIDLHFQSSSTSELNFKYFNSKRIGVKLYEDAFSVFGKIIQINYCFKDEYVGYEYSYQLKKDSFIGVINLGYADGLERLCNGFLVYIKGKYYPLIGRACMNHSFVLLDDDSLLYSKVVFIGKENKILNYVTYFNKIIHEIYLSYLKNS